MQRLDREPAVLEDKSSHEPLARGGFCKVLKTFGYVSSSRRRATGRLQDRIEHIHYAILRLCFWQHDLSIRQRNVLEIGRDRDVDLLTASIQSALNSFKSSANA